MKAEELLQWDASRTSSTGGLFRQGQTLKELEQVPANQEGFGAYWRGEWLRKDHMGDGHVDAVSEPSSR